MSHPFNVILGLLMFLVATLPNPPGTTHFGEMSFGKKLIPWPVMNISFYAMGILHIIYGFSNPS